MRIVTEFHASALPARELNRIAEEYLALEHLRMFRRLLVRRFGLLALAAIVAGAVLHWISVTVTASCLAFFLAPPMWIWVVEVRHDRAFARRLAQIPGAHTSQKVVKSS